jgi:hypothetical protein
MAGAVVVVVVLAGVGLGVAVVRIGVLAVCGQRLGARHGCIGAGVEVVVFGGEG